MLKSGEARMEPLTKPAAEKEIYTPGSKKNPTIKNPK